jgi:diaminohydroxyphosphoribosylaminopyrimidine deaminase/5-amino-6-(5-phosphoribosylamino)uracil reductase
VLTTDKKGDYINLNSVLKALANEGINEILVESGSVLSGAFLREKLVDELVIYQAPLIMGSRTMRMFSTPEWESLSNGMLLDIKDIRKFDRDLKIVAVPVY